MTKYCPECGTKLLVLYYQERKKGKLSTHKIEESYCRKCKKTTIPRS